MKDRRWMKHADEEGWIGGRIGLRIVVVVAAVVFEVGNEDRLIR
jgi:hypothetical protein